MQAFTLNSQAKNIFIFAILTITLLSFTRRSFSQSVTVSSSLPADITICGTTEACSLAVSSDRSSAAPYDLDISFTAGIIIEPATGAGWDLTTNPTSPNLAAVHIDALSSSSPASIVFNIKANCTLSGSAASFTANDPSGQVSTGSINILAGTNGNLILISPLSQGPDDQSHVGASLVRTYLFQNQDINDFNGYLSMTHTLRANPALSFGKIEVFFPNAPTVTVSDLSQPFQITGLKHGEEIRVEETVIVTSCLTIPGVTTQYDVTFASGCRMEDISCNSIPPPPVPVPFVVQDDQFPNLTLTLFPNLYQRLCFGEDIDLNAATCSPNAGTPINQLINVYENKGNATQTNLSFNFNTGRREAFIPVASMKVRIYTDRDINNNIDYTKYTEYDIYRDPANQVPGAPASISDYYKIDPNDPALNLWYQHQVASLGIAGNTDDCIVPVSQLPDFLTDYTCKNVGPDCFNIMRLEINKLIDPRTGTIIEKINLPAGAAIGIVWQEQNCAYNPGTVRNGEYWGLAGITVSGDQCNLAGYGTFDLGGNLRDYYVATQQVQSYQAMMSGDLDFCRSTTDGAVQEFSIKNHLDPDFIDHQSQVLGNNGKFIVQLTMNKGLDLDLSLNNNALSLGYDHASCAGLNCGNPCAQVWSNSVPFYQVSINNGTFSWTPDNIALIKDGYPDGATYELTFTIDSYISAHPGSTDASVLGALNNSFLNFQLRAYCNDLPKSSVHETLFYQPSCAGQPIPFTSSDFDVVVTCPGCNTPGGNILSSTEERKSAYQGYRDDIPEDGIPDMPLAKITDPLLLASGTNGDKLTLTATMQLSDGKAYDPNDPVAAKYRISDLPLSNLSSPYLDNFYFQVDFGVADMMVFDNTVCTLNVAGFPAVIKPWASQSPSSYVFHLTAAELGLAHFDDSFVAKEITFTADFMINTDLSKTGYHEKLLNIIYKSYFSDCDNCDDFTFPGGDATVPLMKLQKDSYYFYCTNGESIFNFIPGAYTYEKIENNQVQAGINYCKKSIEMFHTINFLDNRNQFAREFRNVIEGQTDPIVFSCKIPAGYIIDHVEISNSHSAVTDFDAPDENYTISCSDAAGMVNTDGFFEIGLKYTDIQASDVEKTGSYTGDALYFYDDGASTSVIVFLNAQGDCAKDPDRNCSLVPDQVLYYPGTYNPPTPSPAGLVVLPEITTHVPYDVLTVKAGDYPFPTYGLGLGAIVPLVKPKADLQLSAVPAAVSSNAITIPVFLTNYTDPTLRDIHGDAMPPQNISFPYIHFKNMDALNNAGYSLIGVYEGSDISGTNLLAGVQSGGEWFANLVCNNNQFIPALATNLRYTFQLSYNCPSTCSLFLPSCSSQDLDKSACLLAVNHLEFDYGWNCSEYPTTASGVSNSCYSSSGSIGLNLEPVAFSTPVVTVNDNNPVSPCSDFNYKVSLNSCNLGTINQVALTFNLPAGVIFTPGGTITAAYSDGTAIAAVLSGNKLTLNTTGEAFNNSQSVNITIPLRASCDRSIDGSHITGSAALTSYCSTDVKTVPLPAGIINLTPVDKTRLDDITISSVSFSPDQTQMFIAYSVSGMISHTDNFIVTMPGGSTQTAAVTSVSPATVNINPAILVCGNNNFSVTLSRELAETCVLTSASCSSMINESPVPAVLNVAAPAPVITANGPLSFCQGGSVTLTASSGISYLWSDGETTQSITVSSSGNYSVTVHTSQNCQSTSSVTTVTVNPLPQKPNVTSPAQVCAGSIQAYPIVVTAGTGVNFSLVALPAGSTFSESIYPNGRVTVIVFAVTFGNTSGNLVFRATNAAGCTKDTSIFVKVISSQIAASNASPCYGETDSVYVTSPPPGSTYQWYAGKNAIKGATGSSYVFTANASDNYYVVVSNSGATCTSNTQAITLKIVQTNFALRSGATLQALINGTVQPLGPVLGTYGTKTIIDGQGGTVVLNGIYHVTGTLELTNGMFKVLPGTEVYVDMQAGITVPYYCNSPTENYNFIFVNNASTTLWVRGATFTSSACDQFWGGIALINGSTIDTDEGIFNSVKRNSEFRSMVRGILSYGACNQYNTNRFFIKHTNFFNNVYNSFYDILKGTAVSGEGITDSHFGSDNSAGYTYLGSKWYSQQGISASGWEQTDYSMARFSNNDFTNMMFGIAGGAMNQAKIVNNKFKNVKSWAMYLGAYSLLSKDAITVDSNNILIPSEYSDIPEQSKSDPAGGIYSDDNLIIKNNIITGDQTDPRRKQIGIEANFPNIINGNNTISNVDQAVKGFNNIIDIEIAGNNFINNVQGIVISANPYRVSNVSGRCNSFNNAGLLSGTSYGIFVDPNAYLNDLGTPTNPNGNAFIGFGGNKFPMEYEGTGANTFKYYKSASPQENIQATNKRFQILNAVQPTPGYAANCSGPPGVTSQYRLASGALLSAEDSVNAAMDSLRFQLGTFRQMKEWQYEILSYYEKNNKLDVLYSYADSLKSCNLEAYNTFMLYLMNKYDIADECSKAHVCASEVLNANPNDAEIQARTTHFNYECRKRHGGGLSFTPPFMPMNPRDSIDLAQVAGSGTSLSETACMKLRMRNPKTHCNTQNTYVPNYPDCGPECKKKKNEFLKKGWEKQTGFNADKQGGQLSQNIPNPADNETIIPYLIPSDNYESAYITIQNVMNGQEMQRIELTQAGYSAITVNLEQLPSGVYTYTMVVNGINQDVKRMVVVK